MSQQDYTITISLIETLQYLFCGLLGLFLYIFFGWVVSSIVLYVKRSKKH